MDIFQRIQDAQNEFEGFIKGVWAKIGEAEEAAEEMAAATQNAGPPPGSTPVVRAHSAEQAPSQAEPKRAATWAVVTQTEASPTGTQLLEHTPSTDEVPSGPVPMDVDPRAEQRRQDLERDCVRLREQFAASLTGDQPLESSPSAEQGPPGIQPVEHISKTQKTAKGKQPTSIDEIQGESRRHSSRPLAKKSSDNLASKSVQKKFLTSAQLPPKHFSLLKLLVGDEGGLADDQCEPVESLETAQQNGLRQFWDEAKAKVQSRFDSWFRGQTEGACIATHLWLKKSSDWQHGKLFACKDCMKQQRPCCRVVLNDQMEPAVVAVLPVHGKDGMERFHYWKGKE